MQLEMYTQPVDVSRTKPRRPAVVPESHGCATHVFRLGAQVSRTIRKHQDQSTARTRTTCPRYPRSTQAPQSRASTEAAVRSGGRPELARCAVIAGSMDPNPGLLHSIPPLPESDKQSGILFFVAKPQGRVSTGLRAYIQHASSSRRLSRFNSGYGIARRPEGTQQEWGGVTDPPHP